MKIYHNNYKDQVEKKLNEQNLDLTKANLIGGWIVEGTHYSSLNDIVDSFCFDELEQYRY